jgi:hypothetical protein
LLRNLERAAPALLAALAASDNEIRRHAAYTLGRSRRSEFAAPLEQAIATELAANIHQPYTASGIPDDRYFAALRAMVLALARTGGLPSLKNVAALPSRDPLAVRALDDSLTRVVDRSPCDAGENTRPSCIDKWHRTFVDMEASGQTWSEDEQ